MKKLLVFTLILASNHFFACGFYPYGEDVRMRFLNPDLFKYKTYSEFNYSSSLFYPVYDDLYGENGTYPNDKLWFDYCNGKVDYASISAALFELSSESITADSDNKMIQYLYKMKDLEAINYLIFAKNCESFNAFFEDPWERTEVVPVKERTQLIDKATQLSKSVKSEILKKRYAFLAIRLAFYNDDKDRIVDLYKTNFSADKEKTILNYWSMYFRIFAEKDNELKSFYAAQVYANAPDKRFVVFGSFDRKAKIESILKFAKTNEEKANVYLLAGILKVDKSFDYIKKVYELNPKSDGLSFMLLREINKIEDWVFTPYYTMFSPSIQTNYWYDAESVFSLKNIQKRVAKDRKYASKLEKFIASNDFSKTENPALWSIAQAHLLFASEKYESSLNLIAQLEKKLGKTDAVYKQLQLIKSLNLTANQSVNNAIIKEEVKEILLENGTNKQFIFAIGRELEYKKNYVDATVLYSKLLDIENMYFVWKSDRNKQTSYRDYFYNYYQYIDVYYSANEVEKLIANVKENASKNDKFSVWAYNYIKKENSRLYDLLGTMYIRKDDLKTALSYFNKVEVGYWNDYYSLWQRKDIEGNVFDENPFFTLKYTSDFMPEKENFVANKISVTKRLIQYLEKAANPNEKDRDYYYFLTANCYYNMTINGNAWMMRRFGISANDVEPYPEDQEEFIGGDLAKKYYLLAYSTAKTDKFKSLCLRLAGRCEKNKLDYNYATKYKGDFDFYPEYLLGKNKYYGDLKTKFPDYYDDLMTSGCTVFENYYSSRR